MDSVVYYSIRCGVRSGGYRGVIRVSQVSTAISHQPSGKPSGSDEVLGLEIWLEVRWGKKMRGWKRRP